MKKLFYIIILLWTSTYSQTIDEIYFAKNKVKTFFDFEDKIKSKVHNEKTFFVADLNPFDNESSGLLKTLNIKIYKRANIVFPTGLYVYYSTNKKDGYVNFVMFNWGTFNISMMPQDAKAAINNLSNKEKEFRKQYEIVYEQIFNKYGIPTKMNKKIDNAYYLSDGATWVTKDIVIKLQLKYPKHFTFNDKGFPNETADFCVYTEIFYK